MQLALKTWVWADLLALKVLAQATPYGQGVRLRLAVGERAVDENVAKRRGRYETMQDENASVPCVIYSDRGYTLYRSFGFPSFSEVLGLCQLGRPRSGRVRPWRSGDCKSSFLDSFEPERIRTTQCEGVQLWQ